eukprot:6477935-Amphidinium_carterae.1
MAATRRKEGRVTALTKIMAAATHQPHRGEGGKDLARRGLSRGGKWVISKRDQTNNRKKRSLLRSCSVNCCPSAPKNVPPPQKFSRAQ